MCSTVHPNVDRVPTVNILVDFVRMFTILKCFCCWAVVLSMSFLSVFRAFRHAPRSPTRCFPYYRGQRTGRAMPYSFLHDSHCKQHHTSKDCGTRISRGASLKASSHESWPPVRR